MTSEYLIKQLYKAIERDGIIPQDIATSTTQGLAYDLTRVVGQETIIYKIAGLVRQHAQKICAEWFGAVEHDGQRYILTEHPTYSNRLTPIGAYVLLPNGSEYPYEMVAYAVTKTGDEHELRWERIAIKGVYEPANASLVALGQPTSVSRV